MVFLHRDRDGMSRSALREEKLASRPCGPSSDLVESRVGNLEGLKLRSSLSHFRQSFQHLWIGFEVIGFRVLFLIPKTDSDRFHSLRGDERDQVLETFPLAKQGDNFLLCRPDKLCKTTRLQIHGDVSDKHRNLLGDRSP